MKTVNAIPQTSQLYGHYSLATTTQTKTDDDQAGKCERRPGGGGRPPFDVVVSGAGHVMVGGAGHVNFRGVT